MEKFVCIHGHFYQPPRENPWLESVELQDSAAPYHDWNERVCAECYAPNATARILDPDGRIKEIISNYSRMSFNFGPTLLAWMRDKMPEVHDAIIKADKLSMDRFSGHGSAVAQVYNHMILPLANQRDKFTQVLWGIRDFEHRFGRMPEGMWLAETAADTPSLEVLAELGIKYTILSPFQASRVRELGKRNSKDVNGGHIDPKRPYLVKLPSGRSINVFFYDAPVSQAVAFERLLASGERFAHRMVGAFNDRLTGDQLVNLATDGESYGHHHKHGEMALAYALNLIENHNMARLTNYGEYLETHPPTHQAWIHECSAWSCVHGVGRWFRDCGCNSGGHRGWTQGWREPLRNALDWLRDSLAPLFEAKALQYLKDPWEARNDYIRVILNRSPENMDQYFSTRALRPLAPFEKTEVLKLMEIQRHAMLMYTSCGWFFDELSGIETVQVVQYAARALQLAREVLGMDLEEGFLDRLQHAKSNIAEHRDGRCVYEKFVRPAMIDRRKAMAHYAISSVFQTYPQKQRVFSQTFYEEKRELFTSGKTRLLVGKAKLTSEITLASETFAYAILYLGEHNLTGGVRPADPDDDLQKTIQELKASFEAADLPETIRKIDEHFGKASYSLKDLFKDEQRRILDEIMESTRKDLEHRFRLITERYTPLMRFLKNSGVPLPSALETVQDFILQSDIREELLRDAPNIERLRSLFEMAAINEGDILNDDIKYIAAERLGAIIQKLSITAEEDLHLTAALNDFARTIIPPLRLGLNLWKAQNVYWEMLQGRMSIVRERAQAGQPEANEWMMQFLELGRTLGFWVPPFEPPQAISLAA